MKRLVRQAGIPALVSAVLCSSSGCFPLPYTDAPATAGQVVNRATNRPVPGAAVTMASETRMVTTRTDQNGEFRLPAIRAWHFPAAYIEGHHMYGILRVQAAGYRTDYTRGIGQEPFFVPDDPQAPPRPIDEHSVFGPIHIALSPDA